MNTCLVLSLMGILLIHGATSMVHSLTALVTSSTEPLKFAIVGVFNGLQIYYYDSVTKRGVLKQDWMNKVTDEDPQLLEKYIQMSINFEPALKGFIGDVKQLFNQTEGAHILQAMSGCEWDNETDKVIKGYLQFAFDGENLLSLDWNTGTYVAAKKAVNIKQSWETDDKPVHVKNLLTHVCVEDLKKLVRYGESTLKRTELPLVSLLQKSSSAPVTCHATGFYPDRAMLFWTKDGNKLYENVDLGEILPNHDGTFQMSVDLDVSSIPSEDWNRYQCVFQLSGVKEDLLTRLDKDHIRTNSERHEDRANEKKHTLSIVAAVLVVLGVVILAAVGVFLYKKVKQPSPPPSEPEVMQELNPTN